MNIRPHEFRLHSQELMQNAIESAKRMQDGQMDVLTSILMSSASAEAFIHEMNYLLTSTGLPDHNLNEAGKPPRLPKEFREKYHFVLKDAVLDFSWDDEPYSNLSLIYSLRNKITHFNHIDELVIEGDDSPTQILLPDNVKKLNDLNLLKKVPKDSYYNWFDLIQTKRLAWWVCRTTRDSIVKILTSMPTDFSGYFQPWRKLAIQELPVTKSWEEKAETDGLKILSYPGGEIVYTMDNTNTIFSAAPNGKFSSTIQHAESIINSIAVTENIDVQKSAFYDLQTHIGYPSKESGEYTLSHIKLVHTGVQSFLDGWEDIQKVVVLNDRKPHAINESNKLSAMLSKFKRIIGEVVPF